MLKSPSLTTSLTSFNSGSNWRRRRRKASVLVQVSAVSYQKFIDFALNETKRYAVLAPSPLQVQLSLVCIWIFTFVLLRYMSKSANFGFLLRVVIWGFCFCSWASEVFSSELYLGYCRVMVVFLKLVLWKWKRCVFIWCFQDSVSQLIAPPYWNGLMDSFSF